MFAQENQNVFLIGSDVGKSVKYQLIEHDSFKRFEWLIYGGEDGSVLVYKPRRTKHSPPIWEKLLQCRTKGHGYWDVSLARIVGRREKVRSHEIILRAFDGPPPEGKDEAMHLYDDPDDNRRSHLQWGTRCENSRMRKEHSKRNEHRRSFLVGATISMTCSKEPPTPLPKKRKYKWTGAISMADVRIELSAQSAKELVSVLIYRFIKWNEGIRVLPDKNTVKSQMPEKDKERFTVECVESLGWRVRKPTGFIVAPHLPFEWKEWKKGEYFPKSMIRCSW